jgi:selenocysteine-specific elongation factor
MKEHIIIGTAGHIDHGKTALIKALTGIDTDRLKEEKERGITIDIGFAYWRQNVTIIDVPGHEKFIRNMVAGVCTVDFFLLVIAADDGIMPQTIEHLDILNFFNIRDGIVVLNKIDLVDQHRLTQVQQQVTSLLQDYHLEHLPVVPVSAVTNTNLYLLQQEIENKIATIKQIQSLRPFRLSIDRSFQIKGFGTVVTGTVLSGTLSKGDEVEIYPAGRIVKVRGLQIHAQQTEQVEIGYRAAVNLSDLSKEEVVRGDVLATPASMMPATEFSAMMHTVSHLPLKIKNHSQVHVYTGTTERPGHLFWYEDSRYLQAGHPYHVRLKLKKPIAAAPGDALLLRLHSPVCTVAGGRILEINPLRLPAMEIDWTEYYSLMAGNNFPAQVERIIFSQEAHPISFATLQAKLFEQRVTIKKSIDSLISEQKIVMIIIRGSEHFIHTNHFNFLAEEIISTIKRFHQQNPLKTGINLQELGSGLGKRLPAEELLTAVLRHLQKNEVIKQEQNYYSLAGFSIKIARDTDQSRETILEKLKTAKFNPPDVSELARQLSLPIEELQVLLRTLSRQKQVVAINPNLYLHPDIHEQLIQFLRDYFSKQSQLPVSALKNFMSSTRKYTIPIFEYLDAGGFTTRVGDIRKKGPAL